MTTPGEIRSKFQKPRHQEQIYAWYVTRRISAHITSFLLPTKLTPNHVTILSIFSSLLAGVFFSTGKLSWCVLGAVFFNLMYILDGCDGEIARIKGIFSKEGEYLDKVGHYLTDLAVLCGINLGIYRITQQPFFLYAVPIISFGAVGNRLIYDTAFKVFFAMKYKNGIPPRKQWEKEGDNLFLDWHPSFPIERYEKKTTSSLARKFHILFRIAPHPGYIYDTDSILLVTTAAVIADIVAAGLFTNFPLRILFLVGTFYTIMLPLSFIIRLYLIFKEKMITRWLSVFNKGNKSDS